MNDVPTEHVITYPTLGLDASGILDGVYAATSESALGNLLDTLSTWWTVYSVVAIFMALVFFVGYVYAKIRYGQLSAIEQAGLRAAEKAWANKYAKPTSYNSRWDIIQKRVAENSPESWRIAIIEADIFLEETLTGAGYVGGTLGEKLKSANPQSFTTIQDAWEAHKIRNEIAHSGSDFVLTQKRAQETITRFERVFREFGVV